MHRAVQEMERYVRERTAIPDFDDGDDLYRFLGTQVEHLPSDPLHPVFPGIPGRRISLPHEELERRRWLRISRPQIEARQDYIVKRLFSGHTKGIWPLIEKLQGHCNSQERLWAIWPVLDALGHLAIGPMFWRTMQPAWLGCDATGVRQRALLKMLRQQHATAPARHHDSKGPIIVYRGGERRHAKGISWSRDRAVAERFARGLRGDTDGERVLVTARASRDAVFLYVNDRKEREVVLDPHRVTGLSIQPYDREGPWLTTVANKPT